jgi:protein involved in polysaccharide export with SLBB domain
MESGMINPQFFPKKPLKSSALFHFLATFLILLASVSAFSIQPSAQQLAQFKNMSPAEQSSLAQQLGVSIPSPGQQALAPVVVQSDTVMVREALPKPVSKAVPGTEVKTNAEVLGTALKSFGYDLFAGNPTSFTPVNDIPVSSDYILGAGDSLKVNLYGKESQFFELLIDQEGQAQLSNLGPISLAGLSFSEAKKKIVATINQKMIGVTASVSMGQLRSIRVFLLGEAYMPGSYVISPLSTITNALVLSGGVSKLGSLRNIQLKRKGKLIHSLDLYDLLLKGDTSDDAQLQSGDVVFIPPVGAIVGIQGEVRRPAFYELKGKEPISNLVSYSGGLLSTASPTISKIERFGEEDKKALIDIDIAKSANFELKNGDLLSVPKNLGLLKDIVIVSGEVYRPGKQNWRKGLYLSEAVDTAGLKPETDLKYGLLKRYGHDGKFAVSSFQLADLFEYRVSSADYQKRENASADLLLEPLDEIMLMSWQGKERQNKLNDLVEQLRRQTEAGEKTPYLKVEGEVRFPGSYPITEGLSLADSLSLAGVELTTDMNYALLVRQPQKHQWQLLSFKPQDVLDRGSDMAQLAIQPLDRIVLFSKLEENRQAQLADIISTLQRQADIRTPLKQVVVSGNVRYPGVYPLSEFMNVHDLIYAAGGLTEQAFQLYAEVSRTELGASQTLIQSRLNLDLSSEQSLNTALQSRDVLQIKTIPNWAESNVVTLAGEVRFPGTYSINKGDTLATVIQRAGGITEFAYASGAMFTRVALKAQQAKELEEMQQRLESDIAKAEVVAANQSSIGEKTNDIGEATALLSKLKTTPATGRLVIDLDKVLTQKSDYVIALEGGDRLYIPKKKNSVTIVGEVQMPISQVYEVELSYLDYIEGSGGITNKADEERIYIIKANGGVQIPQSSNWFASNNQTLEPGDTIVVPLDAEKVDGVILWRDMSQIFYQIALGAAAVGSL